MSSDGFRVEHAELAFEGVIVSAEVLSVRTPDGDLVTRQVIRHPGAVAVVAVHDDHVVMVRQYRAALDTEVLELPAGKLDIEGEPLAEAARRELIEEVGLDPATLTKLGSFMTAAGFCDEELTLFFTNDCAMVDRCVDGVEEAHSTIVHVPVHEVMAWAGDGRLIDAKTIIGLYWARDQGLLDA